MKIISIFTCVTILIGPLLLAQNNEFLLDTNLIYMPAPSGQSHPSVTFDGTNYFVAWFDLRNGMLYHSDYNGWWNIYGCRVSPEGVVLDSAGISISYYVYTVIPSAAPIYNPGIAYGNGVYLVSWADFRQGPGGDIYGARVDINGIVLDPDGFIISGNYALESAPATAFDGTNFFVAWYDQRTPYGIYGCRVSTAGTILDPNSILISTSEECLSVSVASDGTNYFVVWGTWEDIYGARVDTAGNVLDTMAIAICTAPGDQSYAAVTFGGTNYFVVWVDSPFSNYADIYGARVDTTGVVLDTNGIAISTLPGSEHHPSIAFDGTNYLVTWSDYATTYCARVDTSGVLLDSIPIVVAQDTSYESSSPSVAFDGTNYFIAWFSGQLSKDEVYGTRVETSGVVIDTAAILLSMSAYPGRASSSSFDGTNYFTVWTDSRDTANSYIYGARVDTFGTILDPACINLMKGKDPAIAFDGTHYLLAGSNIDIKGARINTAGTVFDTVTIFSISPNRCDDPAIVFDETNYFVTFVAWPYGSYIYCMRIDTSGVVLDTNGIVISHGGVYDLGPSAAFDDSSYFVVWYHGTHETTFDIYGARISSTGVLVDTIPISIAAGSYRQWYPSVTFDGTNYFVVWQDNRNGYADIYGARVTPAGVVLDPVGIPICTAPSGQYKPSIGFDGQNYCVIWEDWRNGNYTDIYGCYLSPSGTVLEEFIVSDQPNLQIEPALAKGSNKYLITYTGFIDSLGARPANTMRIWGKFQEFTGIEETTGRLTHDAIHLFQNYPNPFRHITEIRYQLTDSGKANLNIYDVSGRLVRQFNNPTIVQSDQIIWDGRDNFGNYVGAGVYFYRLDTENFSEVKKMILIRE
ncbi:T9SS type A sorting domain-containing protein [candidate division WOR-3 bacterium]|nr:T9SS type A sorting domain-containing protein [candidate division WOR-3 bacterium]